MAIRIKSLDSIEVELGHINDIKSDEYGDSSTIFSTFIVQLPDTNEHKLFMDEFDSQIKCPYCNSSIKITYAKTKMDVIPAIEENKIALKSNKRRKIFLITFGVFFLIEIFYWWFAYVFMEGDFGSSSRLLINFFISVIVLIMVYFITRISILSSLKSSLAQKKNLLIPSRSVKKVKNGLKSLGTFDIITQVRLELKNTFYKGDHVVVGEHVSGRTDFGVFLNKVTTGHELDAFINIDIDQYSSFLDTMPTETK